MDKVCRIIGLFISVVVFTFAERFLTEELIKEVKGEVENE